MARPMKTQYQQNVRRVAECVSRRGGRDMQHAARLVTSGSIPWPWNIQPVFDIQGLADSAVAQLADMALTLAQHRPARSHGRLVWREVVKCHPDARPPVDQRIRPQDYGAAYMRG